MKQIDSMEELRDYVKRLHTGHEMMHCCCDNYDVSSFNYFEGLSVVFFLKKPTFEKRLKNFSYWDGGFKCREIDLIKDIELTFDCDFSKCCWSVED